MLSRIFQVLLGVILFLSSTPVGMAKETISGKARADFFAPDKEQAVASEDCSSGHHQQSHQQDGFFVSGYALAGDPVGQEPVNPEPTENSKRHQHSDNSTAGFRRLTKAVHTLLLHNSLFCQATRAAQDAQQERAKTIRFLHLASDIC